MQRWIMLVILWANASASRYYLYPDYHRKHGAVSTEASFWRQKESAVALEANDVEPRTPIKYNPYNKHHPGRHVCTQNRNASNSVKTNSVCCKPIYKKYMVRCGNQWCSGVRLVYEHYNKQVVGNNGQKSDVTYYCCPGWTQITSRSHGCNKPLCLQPCQNGGVCSKPGLCSCPPGYNGTYCEYKHQVFAASCACQNGGTCTKNACLCTPGYQGAQCQDDVDECKAKPCDQICRNTRGSYSCDCKENFQLQSDRHSCRAESKCCCCSCCCCPRRLSDIKESQKRDDSVEKIESKATKSSKSVAAAAKGANLKTQTEKLCCCNKGMNTETDNKCICTFCHVAIPSEEEFGDGDNALEASDMGRGSIEQRLATLEEFIRERAKNEISKKDLFTLHENMAIIARNVKAMKTQLCKMDDMHSDIEEMKDKVFELEEKTKKLETISNNVPKCPQSIVKICTNHTASSST